MTEFGEEFSTFRRDIVEILREEADLPILAGDIGLQLVWSEWNELPAVRCLSPKGDYGIGSAADKLTIPEMNQDVLFAEPEDVVSVHVGDDSGLSYASRSVQARCQSLFDIFQKDVWTQPESDHRQHFPEGIKGWQYSEREVEEANKNGALLTMDFDTSIGCNLQCKYCFVDGDAREKRLDKEPLIRIQDLKDVFRAAKTLGLKSAKLVGAGEPFLDEKIMGLLKYCSSRGIWVVVFTNGTVLGDTKLCEKIHHKSSQELAKELYSLKVSIMVKLHSLDPEIEDTLVGVSTPHSEIRNYSAIRNRAITLLIKTKFNSPLTQDGLAMTRLGIENVLVAPAIHDVEIIYRLRYLYNLFIDIDPPVPVGLTSDEQKRKDQGLDISANDCLQVAKQLYQLNKRLVPDYVSKHFKGASPYFGSLPCTQLPNGIYVNSLGRIYPCCGCNQQDQLLGTLPLGTKLNHDSLCDILRDAMQKNPYRESWKNDGVAYEGSPHGKSVFHGCPYRDDSGIMKHGWEAKIKDDICG